MFYILDNYVWSLTICPVSTHRYDDRQLVVRPLLILYNMVCWYINYWLILHNPLQYDKFVNW